MDVRSREDYYRNYLSGLLESLVDRKLAWRTSESCSGRDAGPPFISDCIGHRRARGQAELRESIRQLSPVGLVCTTGHQARTLRANARSPRDASTRECEVPIGVVAPPQNWGNSKFSSLFSLTITIFSPARPTTVLILSRLTRIMHPAREINRQKRLIKRSEESVYLRER